MLQMTTDSGNAKIFLCHSSRDKTFVRKLAGHLHTLGVDTWFDEWELKPGDSLFERIGEAIGSSAIFCIVLSPDSVESKWCRLELQEALAGEMDATARVVSVLLRDVGVPPFLKGKVHLDFTRDYFPSLASLACMALGADQREAALRLAARPPATFRSTQKLVADALRSRMLALGGDKLALISEMIGKKLKDRFSIIDRETGDRTEYC